MQDKISIIFFVAMHRLTLKYEVSKFIVITLKSINLMPRGSTHRAVLLLNL